MMPKEDDLFDNKDDALDKAEREAARILQEDLDRVRQKTKPTKSWSWHVHYHRKCLREAEKNMAYHSTALNHAKTLSKEAA